MKLPIILSTHQELAYILSKMHPIDVQKLEDQSYQTQDMDEEITLSCYIRDYKGPCKVYIRSHDENRGTLEEEPHYEIKISYKNDILFHGNLRYFDLMEAFGYVLGSGVRFRKDTGYESAEVLNDLESDSLLFRVLMNYILSYPFMDYKYLLRLQSRFGELSGLPNLKTITLKDYAIIKFKYDIYSVEGLYLVSIYHRDLQDIPMIEFYSDSDYIVYTSDFVFEATKNLIRAKDKRQDWR